jgi:hypothetical protein
MVRPLTSCASALLLLSTAASGAFGQPSPFEPPAKPGWTFLALSDDTLVYVKHHPASGAIRRVWTLYDLPSKREREGVSFMSVASLGEFNCAEQTTRTVEESYYERSGMAGTPISRPPIEPTPWVKPDEGSIGALKLDFACAAKPAI